MEWILEIALIAMLAATLFHALRLERALGALKRDRAVLEELIAGFDTSTRQAEHSVDRLKTAADGAGRLLARQVEQGQALRSDLQLLGERGDQLADRLDHLIRAGRSIPHLEQAPLRLVLADVAPVAANNQINTPPATGLDEPIPRLRSQAERDLLKALRMAR